MRVHIRTSLSHEGKGTRCDGYNIKWPAMIPKLTVGMRSCIDRCMRSDYFDWALVIRLPTCSEYTPTSCGTSPDLYAPDGTGGSISNGLRLVKPINRLLLRMKHSSGCGAETFCEYHSHPWWCRRIYTYEVFYLPNHRLDMPDFWARQWPFLNLHCSQWNLLQRWQDL